MYETLSGVTTSRHQLTRNNFVTQFQSAVTNSHPIISANSQVYSIVGLTQMLHSRNIRYQNRLNFSLSNPTDTHQDLVYQGILDNQTKSSKTSIDLKYDCTKADCLLNELEQSFCQLWLHSELAIQIAPFKQQRQCQLISKLAKALRQLNKEILSIDSRHIESGRGSALKFLKILGLTNEYFLQLARQIQLAQQVKSVAELLEIFLKVADPQPSHFLNFQESGLDKSQFSKHKYEQICYYFITESPKKRPKLDRFLYELNQQILFELINRFDDFLSKDSTWTEIQLYHRDLELWGSRQEQTKWLQCLLSMMSLHRNLAVSSSLHIGVNAEKAFSELMWLLKLKLKRWMGVKIGNQNQKQLLHNAILQQFRAARLSFVPNFSSYHQLRLAYYQISFRSLPQSEKIIVLLLICMEPQVFQKLFGLSSQEFSLSQYQKQLARTLVKINQRSEWSGFIADCIRLVGKEERAQILLMSKDLVESIDWQYVIELIGEGQEGKQLMKVVILRSIKMYQNTSQFLNMGISIETLIPFFEIQVLIQGFIQILTENAKLTQKDRLKFFGIISLYRGQNCPPQQDFSITILEMLFEWFVIRESMLEEDYKSMGQSLKANLQQYHGMEEQVSNFSVRMTQSSRPQSTIRIHNYERIKEIGTSKFMKNLLQKNQYQHLYIGYMQAIGESLCKIRQSKQKIIRRSKLELWVEAYVGKIGTSLKQARGQLFKKLNILRQRNLKLFAKQSF